MSATASLCVHTFYIDNSELISWNNTTLVKVKSKLPFCLSLVHERLADVTALIDNSVRLVLDSSLLFFAQRLVMSDIQMSDLCRLFGSILPYMRA